LEIQSSVPVWVLGLHFSGQVFSTVPIPGASGLGGAIVFPQFATTLSLLNNTSSAISGTVDIFDTLGNPMTISLNGRQASTFTYSIPAQGKCVVHSARLEWAVAVLRTVPPMPGSNNDS
jgi:hypothetical protein